MAKLKEYDVSAKVKKKKKKVVAEEPVKKKKKKRIEVAEYGDDDYDPVFDDEYKSELKPKKKKKKVKAEEDEPILKKAKKLKDGKPKKTDKEKELKKLKKAKVQLTDATDILEKIRVDTQGGGTRKRGQISRTDTGKLVSIVGEHAEEIHKLLETEDIDAAAMAIRKRSLQSMIDVMPFIEDNIRSSNGKQGSYHLKSLYECIHSILGELQALKDRDAIARNFVADVLQPYAVAITNSIIQELNNILTDLRPLVRDDAKQELNQALNASRTRMGATLNAQYVDMRNVTLEFLQSNI